MKINQHAKNFVFIFSFFHANIATILRTISTKFARNYARTIATILRTVFYISNKLCAQLLQKFCANFPEISKRLCAYYCKNYAQYLFKFQENLRTMFAINLRIISWKLSGMLRIICLKII